MTDTPYQRLEGRFRRLAALGEAEAVLHWDLAAIMPMGGAEARAEQLAELKAVRHGLLTEPETGDLLDAAEAAPSGDGGLDAWQAANLREMRRRWQKASALSEDLVVALSKAESACETQWRTARPDADFALVRPALETLLGLVQEKAAAKAETTGLSSYDALLDDYEPDGRAADIDAVFADLEAFLPGFLSQVLDAQAAAPEPVRPEGPFPEDRQKALGERLMAALGFDFDHGRLDVSLHPFCGGTPDDVRITTRYDEDVISSLYHVLHEVGHALYDQGLPAAWRYQPVGTPRGIALHESQALLIEMQVCRSPEFMAFLVPLAREVLACSGPAWDAENIRRLATRVEPGFIRVDADEVTYPLHITLRYRLERALLAGDLAVRDLPDAWSETMENILSVRPPDDRWGCLQDIHWYEGIWGYFPIYTLGAIAAAQLFDAAKRAMPDLPAAFAQGNFNLLLRWLREKVHGKGSSLPTNEIIVHATGRPLDAAAYKSHLANRYLSP